MTRPVTVPAANTVTCSDAFSAPSRCEGTFPPLFDGTRSIERIGSWTSSTAALRGLAVGFALDRTRGQLDQVWIVVEKATLSAAAANVADPLGIPVVALRGYGSQTIIDDMAAETDFDGRPATIVYVGDHDPTGADISRDLLDRLTVHVDFEKIAVTVPQIEELGLTPAPGKQTDSRAAGFVAEYGELVQVEVEAIPPDVLDRMLRDALDEITDDEALAEVLAEERQARRLLDDAADQLSDRHT